MGPAGPRFFERSNVNTAFLQFGKINFNTVPVPNGKQSLNLWEIASEST